MLAVCNMSNTPVLVAQNGNPAAATNTAGTHFHSSNTGCVCEGESARGGQQLNLVGSQLGPLIEELMSFRLYI